jgi:Fe-S oxidoreductase/nitrate reductase gamma subunit
MLSPIEKVIFVLAAAISAVLTLSGFWRIFKLISRGKGKINWLLLPKRLGETVFKAGFFASVFRFRLTASIFHALVGWSFLILAFMDLADPIYALTGFRLFENLGLPGHIYHSMADFANAAVLIGIFYLAIRRFVFHPANLYTRDTTLLLPEARRGIKRDSTFVASFIIVCNVARMLSSSFHLAGPAGLNEWEPFAGSVARLWSGMSPAAINTGEHIAFWIYFGSILVFLPYFPFSKHIHMFFAPLNYALKPPRKSIGELSYVNVEDQTIEQFGAAKLKDLGWEQVLDSYACIMCYRCQEVCPAYNTGKLLSPAALEINKRYHMNHSNAMDADLMNFISAEAVWACTACGACVDICPVNNEPMRDILDIRRNLSMMESAFPKQLEPALRGMERNLNPWNVSQADRMKWAEGLHVPTIEQNPTPDILWWVGCAAATDARAQKTAQAFAQILNAAGVNFAVLGKNEACTGDSARRAGREDIFFGLASQNVSTLNEVAPQRIVTTCPHCLHTIQNEYPAFGGNYRVIHHTQLINELVGAGKIQLEVTEDDLKVTFHDPCYLGRHNGILEAPRQALGSAGALTIEMPRHGKKSFCCGAGGAQMWKEEEAGTERVNTARFAEAKATGVETLAVGCPFCLTMMTDASQADGGAVNVMDVAEIVAKRLKA